jgi:hypothetical protein
MTRINWVRLFVGGLVAAVITFLSDGFLHEQLLSADWKAVYNNLGAPQPTEHDTSMIYFAVFELGRGLVSIFVYVMMRPHFNPGPKTAVLAALVAWIAFSVTGPAQFIPLGFFSNTLWCKVVAFQLVTSILAALAGASLYKDAE